MGRVVIARMFLLARKDVRSLVRSRALVVALVLYPAVMAVLVGALVLKVNASASIALVHEDRGTQSVTVAGKEFSLETYRNRIDRNVRLVDMDREEAMRALSHDQVQGVLVIPAGFFNSLSTMLAASKLELHTSDNTFGEIIAQRIRGGIYDVNLEISTALIDANSSYLTTLIEGGEVEVSDSRFDIYGLQPAEETLRALREEATPSEAERLDQVIEFAKTAQSALLIADDAMRAIASPIQLNHVAEKGESSILTSRAISFVLAVSLTLICMTLVSALLASERDEGVLGRLMRAGTTRLELIVAKLLVGVLVATVIAIGVGIASTAFLPELWSRILLMALAVTISAWAFGAYGALLAVLTRDARLATFASILVALPLIIVSLLSQVPLARVVAAAFPFSPAQHLYNAMLFETTPLVALAIGAGHLAGLTIVATALTWKLLPRLQ